MNLVGLVMLAVCGLPVAIPVVAQGVPHGARAGRAGNSAPRLMVANPFVFAPADSAAAVEVGSATRQGVQELVGDDYNVVTQEQMNDALQQYGYPADAILNNSLAITLAKNIQARIVVTGTLAKGSYGDYTVTARLAGVNDEAGNVVTVEQQPDERLADFGYRLAKMLDQVAQSLSDAKACMNQQETKPDKAVKAAEKAIKKVPTHGLAHFCLYQIAKQQKAPTSEAVKHLEAAVKGDPLSIVAWKALANEYQAANDTANTLVAAKQLLRIAPADQVLRENIFRYFLKIGQPKLALDVAEEGIKIDPDNAELYDLKANACLSLNDFPCVVTALEAKYAADSTKADTLFFLKITGAAAAGEKPDTARLLRWARAGVAKYPENLTLLSYLHRVYIWTGQVDSNLAVTQQILAKDTTAVVPALVAAQALAKANRMNEAALYVDFVKQHGDQTQKNQLAAILVPVASARLQGDSAAGKPRDLPGAVELARQAIALADSSTDAARYGNFILGTALLQQVGELDPQTEQQKSCDMARQEQQLLADTKDALTKASPAATLKLRTDQYLGYVEQYNPRVSAMLKAYCN